MHPRVQATGAMLPLRLVRDDQVCGDCFETDAIGAAAPGALFRVRRLDNTELAFGSLLEIRMVNRLGPGTKRHAHLLSLAGQVVDANHDTFAIPVATDLRLLEGRDDDVISSYIDP
jgi:hypothetical protein